MFYKKKKKKDELNNNQQPKKKGLSERTITILVVVGLLLISLITGLANSAGDAQLGDLKEYMSQFNQQVNITITDPVSAVSEDVVKGKLFAAGLKTIATKEELVLEDIVANTESLTSDLELTQAQLGALFNIILTDDTYDMKIMQLKVSKEEENYAFKTYISLNLSPLTSSMPEEYKKLIPEKLTIKYDLNFTKDEEGYKSKDSDFTILNFSDDINVEVVKLFESILNNGESVEQTINNALIQQMNNVEGGIISWLGSSGIIVENEKVTFLKKVT